MKLIAIEIVGFGKWQQYKINFQEGNQLLYGVNEVGKSTIYQFIQAMLFGFPTKGKRRKDYQPKNGGSYGGRLWLDHPVYGTVMIERFKEKKRGQAIVFFNEQIGDESTLKKMIHPLTKTLFQSVFTFQQEQLNQFDSLTEEELQMALLSLGLSGSQQLLEKRDYYFKQAQSIYKGKGSQPPLNQKLVDYHDLQQQINKQEQQESTYQKVLETLSMTKKRLAEKKDEQRQLNKKILFIEKKEMNIPLYQELLELKSELKQTEQQATTTLGAQEELTAAYQQYRFLKDEVTRLTEEITVKNEGSEESDNYYFYLENEQKIQQLLSQQYAIDKLLGEIDWLNQSYQQNRQEMSVSEERWDWQSEQPPHLFFNDQQLNELQQQSFDQTVQIQKMETDLSFIEEEIDSRERNLSAFEASHKKMFQNNQRKRIKPTYVLSCIAAVLVIFSSFFWTSYWRIFPLVIGMALLIFGLYSFFFSTKELYRNEKKEWQKKLSQLDYLNEQRHDIQKKIKKTKRQTEKEEQQITQLAVEHHLGEMNQIDDWTNHRQELVRYVKLVETNKEFAEQLLEKQKQLTDFMEQTASFSERLPMGGQSLKERMMTIADFADRMEEIRFMQEYQVDSYTRKTLKELKEKQQKNTEEIQALLNHFNISSIEEIPHRLYSDHELVNKQKRKVELEQMVGALFEQESETTIAELPAQSQLFKQQSTRLEEEIQSLHEIEQKSNYQCKQLIADGTLDELYQKQAMIKAEVEELALNWTGYQLSAQLLMDLLTELSEQQLPNLLKKATMYFKVLTNDTYRKIQLYEGQLLVEKKTNQSFQVFELSTGTRDQLVMAIRFAFLSMQEDQVICPIMIDDGWLHYDSQRKAQLAKLFATFGEKQQVICFSSDQEMVSYYKERNQLIIELEGV